MKHQLLSFKKSFFAFLVLSSAFSFHAKQPSLEVDIAFATEQALVDAGFEVGKDWTEKKFGKKAQLLLQFAKRLWRDTAQELKQSYYIQTKRVSSEGLAGGMEQTRNQRFRPDYTIHNLGCRIVGNLGSLFLYNKIAKGNFFDSEVLARAFSKAAPDLFYHDTTLKRSPWIKLYKDINPGFGYKVYKDLYSDIVTGNILHIPFTLKKHFNISQETTYLIIRYVVSKIIALHVSYFVDWAWKDEIPGADWREENSNTPSLFTKTWSLVAKNEQYDIPSFPLSSADTFETIIPQSGKRGIKKALTNFIAQDLIAAHINNQLSKRINFLNLENSKNDSEDIEEMYEDRTVVRGS